MKTIQKLSVLLVCLALGFMSMKCDNSPEPDFEKWVSYQISAELDNANYTGPKNLSADIKAWIEKNEFYKDIKFNYVTGEASEFSELDARYIKEYEPFKAKFVKYLEEDIKDRLAKNSYGKDVKVNASFRVFAERGQGQDRVLMSETVTFTYP